MACGQEDQQIQPRGSNKGRGVGLEGLSLGRLLQQVRH